MIGMAIQNDLLTNKDADTKGYVRGGEAHLG